MENKEQGLNSGADDYLTKPLSPQRIERSNQSLFAQPRSLQLETLVAGELCLDRNKRQLSKAGEAIHLRPKEYAPYGISDEPSQSVFFFQGLVGQSLEIRRRGIGRHDSNID